MDISLDNIEHVLQPRWDQFGRRKNRETSEKVLELMTKENFNHTLVAPMSEK